MVQHKEEGWRRLTTRRRENTSGGWRPRLPPSRSPPMTRKFGGGVKRNRKKELGGARGGRRRLFRRKAIRQGCLVAPPSQKRTHQTKRDTRCLQIESNQESLGLMRPLPLSRSSSSRGRSGMRDGEGTRNFCYVFPPRDRGEVGTVRHHFIHSFMTQVDGNAPVTARE
jgi:hypothetical protein